MSRPESLGQRRRQEDDEPDFATQKGAGTIFILFS